MRQQYTSELEQLALQVELMGVLVDENLERMRTVLNSGNLNVAEEAIRTDDRIDAMNVSLMERSYELLRREAPVASDLRLIVSVLRVTAELERIGDLALRIAKLAPEHELLTRVPTAFDILETLAGHAVSQYRDALRALGVREVNGRGNPDFSFQCNREASESRRSGTARYQTQTPRFSRSTRPASNRIFR